MFEKARRTLVWWNIGVTVSLIAAIILAMYIAISNNLEQEINRDLTADAAAIIRSTRFVPTAQSGVPVSTILPTTTKQDDDDKDSKDDDKHEEGKLETSKNIQASLSAPFFFLVDEKGVVLENPAQINTPGLPDLTVLKQVLKGQAFYQDVKLADNSNIRLYSVPVALESGKIAGMVQVGKNLASYQNQLNNVLIITGLAAFVGLILAVAAAIFLTRHALIPLRLSMERQREFVADASHELRTPLSLIKANAEVALRDKKKTIDQSSEYLEDICLETDFLTRLVADLLTLAQSDMGKQVLKPEPVEMQRLAQEVVRNMQPLATAKKVELLFEETGYKGEIWLHGDPQRLRQLLIILLDNAIKYTSQGEIRLSLHPGHGRTMLLKVSDTGIGIPQDKLDRIFERFFRVDKARTRREGGFGLGLSIAQWIVQAHGGTLKASSEEGKGSTFTVTLPVLQPPRL
jgi:signal transduction histidine kinase